MSDFIRPASGRPRYDESGPSNMTMLKIIGFVAAAIYLLFAIIILTTS
jgi:hypothetical protein